MQRSVVPNPCLDEYGYAPPGKWGCVVLLNLSRLREKLKDAIGHEFAHVFYNHPVDYPNLHPSESEKDRIRFNENEAQAKAKAAEWGFRPIEHAK